VWTAETVLLCALSLLARPEDSFPEVAFVHTAPEDASRDAEAYVRPGDGRIFLITSSRAFVRARASLYKCGEREALLKLASVLAHEEWHIRHGSDEEGAYAAQLMTLTTLKAGPGTPVFQEVHRSMRAVLRRQTPITFKPARARRLSSRRSRASRRSRRHTVSPRVCAIVTPHPIDPTQGALDV
jgi:hypothetical protein